MIISKNKIEKQDLIKKTNDHTTYECMSCKKKVKIDRKARVVCEHCGSRVLFKLRTDMFTEYLCR